MNRPDNFTATLCFGLLIAAYLLFILLASFYLTDMINPARAARAGAGELFFLPGEFRLRWWNLRDISTNLLLYMPLGFLVAMLQASRGKSLRPVLLLWFGAALSLLVESGQAFTGRFSDATDVVSNGTGYLLGFLIARAGVERYGLQPSAMLGFHPSDQSARLNTLSGLRFVFVAVTLVTALLPFDLSVSMSQVYAKLQTGGDTLPRLIVDPLFHFRSDDPQTLYLVQKILLFLPLAFLSSYIDVQRNRFSLVIPAFHCLLLASLIEGANLFVQSGRSDIAVPVIAFLTGLATAAVMRRVSHRAGTQSVVPLQRERLYLLLSIALLYGLVLLAVSLAPYDFELSLRAIREKLLEDTNLIPFRLHFSARSIGSAVDIVREFMLYAPFGALQALWLKQTALNLSRRRILQVSVFVALCIAVWIELLQLAVVGRYVDVTDILLAAAGGLAGSAIAPLFERRSADPAGIQGNPEAPGATGESAVPDISKESGNAGNPAESG